MLLLLPSERIISEFLALTPFCFDALSTPCHTSRDFYVTFVWLGDMTRLATELSVELPSCPWLTFSKILNSWRVRWRDIERGQEKERERDRERERRDVR